MIDRPPLPIDIPDLKPADLDRSRAIYGILIKCCDERKRCPTLDQFAYWFSTTTSSILISRMAKAGILRVEITNKNYRTVWICAGPHAGKSTLPPANPTRAYVVLGPARPAERRGVAA